MQSPIVTKSHETPPGILEPGEKPCKKVNKDGTAPIVLVCEHASSYIPKIFNGLGLDADVSNSHIAWDPGALDLAMCLSRRFDASLIHSNISRLVYDCNRPSGDASAMAKHSEVFEVPGNANISSSEAQERIEQIYIPFADALDEVIAAKKAQNIVPALITIHSFTPVYFGQKRDVEIGILHASDQRLADEMLLLAPTISDLKIERNQPYGPKDGVAHTLKVHGLKNNLPNVMIEVRNDLLTDQNGVEKICNILSDLISKALPKISSSIHRSSD